MSAEKKRTKQAILDSISKLLDANDCVVRIQRELTHEQANDRTPHSNFITGKRVTIIIAGTES